MSRSFDALKPYLDRAMAMQSALVLFEWDDATLAPKQAGQLTGNVISILSGEYFQAVNNDEVKALVKECRKDSTLTQLEAAQVRELSEELDKLDCIPKEEYQAFARLTSEAVRVWTEAKEQDDFDLFAPTLKKVIQYQKKFAGYRAKDGEKKYDVMLHDYEPGFNMELLDQFFETVKQEIVPLLRAVQNSRVLVRDDFLTGEFTDEQQERIGRFIAEYVGFDFSKGVMAVSAHPFTTNLHNKDVRITTHYNERLDSSLFSIIHESGHALYEFGIRDDLTQTLVGQGASMGMHESQSRFFENMIGRNKSFWLPIYEKLQEVFPETLTDIGLDLFVKAINKAACGFIRTEADELTYSLHVLVRYELEKQLIEGDLSVEELPKAWADKYEEYLGIRPEHQREGVLQDIHWSQGSFGYFPSYALGSAFGAQLYYHMKKEMDFEGLLEEGRLDVIREYLREHIHQYGKLKDSRTILKDTTGEDFNPDYYVRYLKEKYQKLYHLEKEME
ncbi:MAG: carboxypeptidase M32 [Lachnospiraceae bacterium]|nr:carboxypeptidase M32 [Lachnospiraceae bacterium]